MDNGQHKEDKMEVKIHVAVYGDSWTYDPETETLEGGFDFHRVEVEAEPTMEADVSDEKLAEIERKVEEMVIERLPSW